MQKLVNDAKISSKVAQKNVLEEKLLQKAPKISENTKKIIQNSNFFQQFPNFIDRIIKYKVNLIKVIKK